MTEDQPIKIELLPARWRQIAATDPSDNAFAAWYSCANELARSLDYVPTPKAAMYRALLVDVLETLALSDSRGIRAERIAAPEDVEIRQLCERIGYGAVMDSAARLWRHRDPIGAHTTGACAATVRTLEDRIRKALKKRWKTTQPATR